VASNAAFQPVPCMSVYAATKAFVLHFSEGLAQEVKAEGVRVLALCPGATATGFWSVAGALEGQTGMMTSPEKVVDTALRAFEGRGAFVVPGLGYKLLAFAADRLAPRWLVPPIAGWLFGRQQ
jgi:short-subunit dehydrogenase